MQETALTSKFCAEANDEIIKPSASIVLVI
jgi:hypothetical protein